jgi:MFS family permease
VTLIMLALSERSGLLAERIGPRIPMAAGPAVCAAALLLMTRINATASYWTDVLPAVCVFGLGLAITVAPLTATVLGTVAERHAGIASGVNNAVARAGSLIAVAALPLIVGLTGAVYQRPDAFGRGFRSAALVCAGVLAAAAVLAWTTISSDALRQPPLPQPSGTRAPQAPRRTRFRPPCRRHCAVGAPPLQCPVPPEETGGACEPDPGH